MPRLTVDQFDDEPKVGDKIKVIGRIKSISDDGEVEATYDEVKILSKEMSDDKEDMSEEMEDGDEVSDSYSLDNALSQNFNKGR